MSQPESSIAANLQRLRDQIAEVCAQSQRQLSDVALMAVSKLHPAEAVLEAYEAGQRLFGENRVQEWQLKSQSLALLDRRFAPPDATAPGAQVAPGPGDAIEIHLIGPLQNNKTARAAELFHAVDTIDSLKTAQRLNSAVASSGNPASPRTLPVLIEVKLSPEETKHGVAPEDLPALLAGIAPLSHLRVQGLMTVPPWSEDAEVARPYFQRLRRLRDENLAAYPTLTQLSMGMSNDFRVAIEEGSTTIRVGTAIFGRRSPQQ
jgi:pyridoxal phosphate enzyme (YggS family)